MFDITCCVCEGISFVYHRCLLGNLCGMGRPTTISRAVSCLPAAGATHHTGSEVRGLSHYQHPPPAEPYWGATPGLLCTVVSCWHGNWLSFLPDLSQRCSQKCDSGCYRAVISGIVQWVAQAMTPCWGRGQTAGKRWPHQLDQLICCAVNNFPSHQLCDITLHCECLWQSSQRLSLLWLTLAFPIQTWVAWIKQHQ